MTERTTSEVLSPAQIEDKIRQCVSDLTRADETDAEIAYRAAHRQAMLAADAPKVTRGGYTAAEREAWVDQQCAEQWVTYRRAQTAREAAVDHARTVRDITSAVQSVASLIRASFSLAGAER
jgi:hypothetical protein